MDRQETREKPQVVETNAQAEPAYMGAKKSQKEPVTQSQLDSVITSEDLPNPIFRFAVTLVVLFPLLFVAAIYYGILKI